MTILKDASPMREGKHYQLGMTLVELVMTLAIIGVLAAVAMPRFADTDQFRSRFYAEDIAAALRYAQKYALASGCEVSATIAPSSYALTLTNQCGATVAGTAVTDPSSGNNYTSANSGVQIPTGGAVVTWNGAAVLDGAPADIRFGSDGRISNAPANAAATLLVIGPITLTINPSGYVQ